MWVLIHADQLSKISVCNLGHCKDTPQLLLKLIDLVGKKGLLKTKFWSWWNRTAKLHNLELNNWANLLKRVWHKFYLYVRKFCFYFCREEEWVKHKFRDIYYCFLLRFRMLKPPKSLIPPHNFHPSDTTCILTLSLYHQGKHFSLS